VEDWTAFAPLKPPEEAPDVGYIVLDAVGFSAMCSYGADRDAEHQQDRG